MCSFALHTGTCQLRSCMTFSVALWTLRRRRTSLWRYIKEVMFLARRGARREARRRLSLALGRRRGHRRAGALDGRARRRPAPPRRAAGHEAPPVVRRPAARVPLQLGPGRAHGRGHAAGAAAPVARVERALRHQRSVRRGRPRRRGVRDERAERGAAPRATDLRSIRMVSGHCSSEETAADCKRMPLASIGETKNFIFFMSYYKVLRFTYRLREADFFFLSQPARSIQG